MSARIGLVGGRGYTGGELLGLIAAHPSMELAFASSGSQAGQLIHESCPQWPDKESRFIALDRENLSGIKADAWVLAVPNGAAVQWAAAISAAHPNAVIIDLSADHRFDEQWAYGLPEHHRDALVNARRIANPGCYATAAQLALVPLAERIIEPPALFGVSGYSGAGKTPSPKNDPARLSNNLMAYALTGHMHEREVSYRLGRDVRFMPHVAEFFRGISMTLAFKLDDPMTPDQLFKYFTDYYAHEPRVGVQMEIPEVADITNTPDALLGGFTVDKRDPARVVMVSVLDNLSKGAATQAIQNLNLALGINEHEGLSP